MGDYGRELEFGLFTTPNAADLDDLLELVDRAEALGLELVTIQDHPYQRRYLDAWTLLAVLGARTERIRLSPNVANLPLRPPVVLAKSAASLDVITGGRVELGLGAGSFWDAVAAAGGPRRSPGEAVRALIEAVEIIRAFWRGGTLDIAGEFYSASGLRAGPVPPHDIPIWLGAIGPRMLGVTGRLADAWVPSMAFVPPEQLAEKNRIIDDAAHEAGREPADITRIYNIDGTFGSGPGLLEGTPRNWAEQLAELTLTTGMSTYILATDDADQLTRFAEEVVPAVREMVADDRS